MPNMAVWSVRHHLSPFQWIKMIPSSVSISYVRRMILASHILLSLISDRSRYNLGHLGPTSDTDLGSISAGRGCAERADTERAERLWRESRVHKNADTRGLGLKKVESHLLEQGNKPRCFASYRNAPVRSEKKSRKRDEISPKRGLNGNTLWSFVI